MRYNVRECQWCDDTVRLRLSYDSNEGCMYVEDVLHFKDISRMRRIGMALEHACIVRIMLKGGDETDYRFSLCGDYIDTDDLLDAFSAFRMKFRK